jgi:hypothetical protein
MSARLLTSPPIQRGVCPFHKPCSPHANIRGGFYVHPNNSSLPLGQGQRHVKKEVARESIDLDRGGRPGSLAHARRTAAGLADRDCKLMGSRKRYSGANVPSINFLSNCTREGRKRLDRPGWAAASGIKDIGDSIGRRSAPGITDLSGGAEQPGRVAVRSRQDIRFPAELFSKYRTAQWPRAQQARERWAGHGRWFARRELNPLTIRRGVARLADWKGRGGPCKPLSVPEIID